MRNAFLLLLILIHFATCAQVTFIQDSIPAYTPEEDFLYIAGDFNGWNPGDLNHRLHKNDD